MKRYLEVQVPGICLLWRVSRGNFITRDAAVKVVPNTLDTAGRTYGTRTGRARATLALCASACTKASRFAFEPVSSILIPYPYYF
jgi:hypothetical protein